MTGEAFPDALSAAPLAGAVGGPMLLTRPDALPAAVLVELKRLGVDRVFIIGGRSAVGGEVTNALANAEPAIAVERIYGETRYETARNVAERVAELASAPADTVFVATGATFPDAVAASSIAYGEALPVLLARPGADNAGLVSDLKDIAPANVVVLGGTAAVSAETYGAIDRALSSRVTRVYGPTRYDTAIKIADWAVSQRGYTWRAVGLATGERFPDALVAGPLLGGVRGPVLMTPTTALYPSVGTKLTSVRDDVLDVYYIGGTSALGEGVRTSVSRLLR